MYPEVENVFSEVHFLGCDAKISLSQGQTICSDNQYEACTLKYKMFLVESISGL